MKEKKITSFEGILIFLCILLKYLITYGISRTVLYLFLLCLIFLVIVDIYNKKLEKKELIIITFLGIVSIYFVIIHQDVNFLISLIIAIICIKKNNKSYIKSFLVASVILYILTLFLNYIGILESNNMIRITEEGIGKRYSLGFNHPNEVFLFFIPIALTGYYLYSDKKRFYVILFSVATILYKLSYCRTGYIVILLIIGLHLLLKVKNIKRLTIKLLPYSFIMMTILSIGIAIIFGDTPNNKVSEYLSGRPYYWNLYNENDKLFSVLGKNSVKEWHVDNFYLYLLIELGIIGYLIYYSIYTKSLRGLKEKDEKLSIIIFIFMIYGITEMNVIIGSINFAFALQLKEIVQNNKKERIGDQDAKTESKYNNSCI